MSQTISSHYSDKANCWQNLSLASEKNWQLEALFQDTQRAQTMCAGAANIYIDYSKQLVDADVLSKLVNLADACHLEQRINALMQGEQVNITEQRAALHTALRLPKDAELLLNGKNINHAIQNSLDKAETIVEKIRQKVWRGFSGAAITDVVNIGVGGSDLGPLMATSALDEFSDTDIQLHFASSMDGTQIDQLLKSLHPETTLFIVSSKSFSTVDTMSNANTALAWLLARCADKQVVLKNHFIGVSANPDKMTAWGIVPDNQLLFWEWVGGRFSLWSVIGLAIAIQIGMSGFRELLAGAREMDRHFSTAALSDNLPVIMGLLGVWNSTFLGINAHTILPYDGRLNYLPNYLTQLEMESNGKSVTLQGEAVDYATSPILWGDIGSNAQHAYYQLLHQGTQKVSCDFIAPISRYGAGQANQAHDESLIKQHSLALANCLAQSRVMAFGNQALSELTQSSAEDINPHKTYRGNQPSTTILLDELNPFTLGALIAMYEHKVFVMSVIWDINPFDQWGVEIGKVMATSLLEAIQAKQAGGFDSSTNTLLEQIFVKQVD